tara:strand:+ start:689 stop:829 length:141 start_codon:yes stop_codon:yes gene_type:complete
MTPFPRHIDVACTKPAQRLNEAADLEENIKRDEGATKLVGHQGLEP